MFFPPQTCRWRNLLCNVLLLTLLTRQQKKLWLKADWKDGKCSCGEAETVRHVLIHCDNYWIERSILQAELSKKGAVDYSLKSILSSRDLKSIKAVINDSTREYGNVVKSTNGQWGAAVLHSCVEPAANSRRGRTNFGFLSPTIRKVSQLLFVSYIRK